MKLRYYLRGLGTGIVVTALILIIASGDKESLSDAEIKERAAKLGMVESSSLTLADIQTGQEQDNPEIQESKTQETQEQQEQTLQESQEQKEKSPQESQEQQNQASQPQETEKPQETTEPLETTEPQELLVQPQVTPESQENLAEAVLITVESGASSYTVSKLLENAGLVEDAGEFDTYLCNNGYSRSIRTGKHEIPSNATWEEMAKIISGKQ